MKYNWNFQTSHGITHTLSISLNVLELPRYELDFSSRFLGKGPNLQTTN